MLTRATIPNAVELPRWSAPRRGFSCGPQRELYWFQELRSRLGSVVLLDLLPGRDIGDTEQPSSLLRLLASSMRTRHFSRTRLFPYTPGRENIEQERNLL